MALAPLVTPLKEVLGPDWELVVTEAGRSGHGLRATHLLLNGTPQVYRTLVLGNEEAQEAFITTVTQVSGFARDVVLAALLKLTYATEGVLREMEATRATSQVDDGLPGRPLTFEELDPWPDPVDGAGLLDALAETFATYIVLPPGGKDLLALWTLHTYVLDAAHCTPILGITSPQKRCGKTTVLSVLAALTYKPLPASNISPAAVFRTIEQCTPTLLVDEADTFLRDNDELRGVLNSGHTRDMAFVIRTTGEDHEPRTFSTWCPKAVALIGELPETLHDRAVQLPMQRRTTAEPIQKWRAERRETLMDLRRQCVRWAQDALSTLRNAAPVLPATLHDRAADNWAPLVAIAESAGGEWPLRSRRAIQALTDGAPEDDAAGVMLLQDMQQLFDESQMDRLRTADILHALAAREERPWPEWSKGKPLTARQLARLLAPFKIRPKNIKYSSGEVVKGYLLDDCCDAFARYRGAGSAISLPTSNGAGCGENSSATCAKAVADEKSHNPASNKAGSGVAHAQGVPARPYVCPYCRQPVQEIAGSNGERFYCVDCKKTLRRPKGER